MHDVCVYKTRAGLCSRCAVVRVNVGHCKAWERPALWRRPNCLPVLSCADGGCASLGSNWLPLDAPCLLLRSPHLALQHVLPSAVKQRMPLAPLSSLFAPLPCSKGCSPCR